jgi:hypothetical protein
MRLLLRQALFSAALILPAAGCRRPPPDAPREVDADSAAPKVLHADASGEDKTLAPEVGVSDAGWTQDAAALCPEGAASFDACGCGCCGPPAVRACYYPERGESISTIPNPMPTNCALAGCSLGTHYVCCAGAGAAPTGNEIYCYTIDRSETGGYHIMKTQAGGCATLHVTARPGSMFPISTPPDLVASGALRGVCNGDFAEDAIGGLGSVAITNGKLDVHVVLYFERAGGISSERLDVDQLDRYCN